MIFKKLLGLTILLSTVGAAAEELRFTSGTLLSDNSVQLVVAGPTNTSYVLERLNRTNQVWEQVSSYYLAFSPATLTSTLSQGNYGFFRTRSTNSTLLSTNAFGAVVGSVGHGYTLLGNPFGSTTISNIFRTPVDGMSALQWQSSSASYETADYIGGDGWTTNFTITGLEGFFVNNPGTNSIKYIFSGLFGPYDAKYLPAGNSLIASQQLLLISPSVGQSDLLSTNTFGGYSQLPVLSPGFSPQCRIDKYIQSSQAYAHYYLTNLPPSTNLVWALNGTNSTIPLYLAEGFWINKPTNTWWQMTRPIW